MDYRRLIEQSWGYTQGNKRLIFWYGFIPAIFTTTVGVGYIAYQFFAFKESFLFNETDESFFFQVIEAIWAFISTHLSLTLPLVIATIFFFLFYILYPTLAKASAIQVIARNKNGQKAGISTGFRYGVMSFLKLFEYHLLIKTFSLFTILIEMSFVIRNLGPVIFTYLMPFFIVFMVVGFVLTLLFTYTDFFIVIDDMGVFESMKRSAKLVIAHWKHTFLITILMILIGIRVVIQAVMVFLIPALIVLISGYLATVVVPATGFIIGGIVGLIALIVAAYLNGIVDIFTYCVWTFTFLELTSEKEVNARAVFVDDVPDGHKHFPGHKNL